MKITSFEDYLYKHPFFDTFTKMGVLKYQFHSLDIKTGERSEPKN